MEGKSTASGILYDFGGARLRSVRGERLVNACKWGSGEMAGRLNSNVGSGLESKLRSVMEPGMLLKGDAVHAKSMCGRKEK